MLNAIRQILNVGKGKILLGNEQGLARPVELKGDIKIDHRGNVTITKDLGTKVGGYFSV